MTVADEKKRAAQEAKARAMLAILPDITTPQEWRNAADELASWDQAKRNEWSRKAGCRSIPSAETWDIFVRAARAGGRIVTDDTEPGTGPNGSPDPPF